MTLKYNQDTRITTLVVHDFHVWHIWCFDLIVTIILCPTFPGSRSQVDDINVIHECRIKIKIHRWNSDYLTHGVAYMDAITDVVDNLVQVQYLELRIGVCDREENVYQFTISTE